MYTIWSRGSWANVHKSLISVMGLVAICRRRRQKRVSTLQPTSILDRSLSLRECFFRLYTVKYIRISTVVSFPYFSRTGSVAWVSLFRRFTDTNVFAIGSVKIWKTRHRISVDIRIFLHMLRAIDGFARSTDRVGSIALRDRSIALRQRSTPLRLRPTNI